MTSSRGGVNDGIPKMSFPVFGTAPARKKKAGADTGQTQPGRPETRTRGQADTPAQGQARQEDAPAPFPRTFSLDGSWVGALADSRSNCSLAATIRRSQRTSVFLFGALASSFFLPWDSSLSPSWGDSGVATIHHPS